MANFFEKLKKGMGIEGPVEEEIKKDVEKKAKMKKPKKLEIKPFTKILMKGKAEPIEPEVEKIEEPEVKKEEPSLVKAVKDKEKWFEPEGQLAIDIYQTENELVIRSAIAGVKPEFVDISFERDIIIIRGKREKPSEEKEDYFSQECYWGPFSREIILPVEVDPNLAEATMKEGILTIRLPKIEREKKRVIKVRA